MNDATPFVRPHSPALPDPTGVRDRIGAVVIGRNEGARLEAGLASLRGRVGRTVYVDSGSTDGSIAAARRLGAEVVELDRDRPFTAARARNAGLAALVGDGPPEHIQFVDGDTTVDPAWIATATRFLDGHPRAAVVCGRRRERFPQASVYNRLCDWEWDTPVGRAKACGGDALMRVAAVVAVGGYDEEIIAAEDDELCIRLRKAGWEVWRIDADMTWHDAAIHRFGQWWRRSVRAGHAFAQVGALHPEHFVAERRRVWIWGALLPAAALAGLAVASWITLGVVALYGLSFARMGVRFAWMGMPATDALRCAGLVTLSKLCNLQGVFTYRLRRLRRQAGRIIEYK